MKIIRYSEMDSLLMRCMETSGVGDTVRAIIENVVKNGDDALLAYCEKFDGAKLDALQVSEQEIDEAMAAIPAALKKAMETAAANIPGPEPPEPEKTETAGDTRPGGRKILQKKP